MPPSRHPSLPANVDLTIERVPVERVRYDLNNTRRHNTRNLDAIERSLRKFGQRKPLVVDQDYVAVAGNGTLSVIVDRLGWEYVSVSVFPGTAEEARAYGIADNQTGDLSEFDDELLGAALGQFPTDLLAATGIDADRVAELLALAAHPASPLPDYPGGGSGGGEFTPPPSYTDPDDLPEVAERVITRPGDVWLLGPHRLGCGDSTDPVTVKALLGDAVPVMLHADPPYGMGKEAVGVLNDNQSGSHLDRFQMNWWTAWRDGVADNGSVYIWGRAPDLWRLWYVGGLADDGELMMRNEIVWDKGVTRGLRDPDYHMYPLVTERCLFLMRGPQALGSQNQDHYWEGYEPLRSWLEEQTQRAGWTKRDINRITGTNMATHWLSRSQFTPVPERHYNTLQAAADGTAFEIPYDNVFGDLFGDSDPERCKRNLAEDSRAARSYFDNTHEVMADVWRFPTVAGEERFGHATPKPVAMVERALRSSSREGDAVGVPFAGTGPEFIAGHRLGRRIYGLELHPQYCDTILRRYQQHTGLVPILAATGEEHDFLT